MEDIEVDPVNYAAIILLENLGNNAPSQQQIDLAELLIVKLYIKCKTFMH